MTHYKQSGIGRKIKDSLVAIPVTSISCPIPSSISDLESETQRHKDILDSTNAS